MDYTKLSSYVDSRKQEYLNELSRMIRIESISADLS